MPGEVVSLKAGTSNDLLNSGEMVKITNESPFVDIDRAKEIFNDSFFGPAQVEEALGITLEPQDIPPITFSESELLHAGALRQQLILRVNNAEGEPITIDWLFQRMKDKINADPLLRDTTGYNDNTSSRSWMYNYRQIPRAGWALVSKTIVTGSMKKNYLDQTYQFAKHLSSIYAHTAVPHEVRKALFDFQSQEKDFIEYREMKDVMELEIITGLLTEMDLNLKFRQSAVEVVYDRTVEGLYTRRTHTDPRYVWTNSRAGGHSIAIVGLNLGLGINVTSRSVDNELPLSGVFFSRIAPSVK